MVSVPGLKTYAPDQLLKAREFSPAFARYERLLESLTPDNLRFDRHTAWLECVLATYFHPGSSEVVCRHWSEAADKILIRAWQDCGLDKLEVALFALGKLGANELNLSSDVDLLLVAEGSEALAAEKPLRRFQQLLQQPDETGFCFRLDFDLRPGGKMGPLLTTPAQFQDYYWSQGETWERLALVRLRPLVGPSKITEQILELAQKFSFRKFLDFTLLEDLKALRSQVHQKGFQRKDHELHLKLEVGGIRDIELFVHSLLVLNGGKLPELQTGSTTLALQKLKEKKLLPESEADALLDSYWFFRQVENTVQSLEDRQTHSLTTRSLPILPSQNEVAKRMHAVDKIVSTLLGAVDLESIRLPQDTKAQMNWLKELGFSDASIETSWEQLIQATALSHKNDRDERARQEFLFSFVTELAKNISLDRDLGLSLLVDFVKATRAKATFFSMLLRSPRLIQDLARIFCLSPYLGSIVASRPELLDHFILQLDEGWTGDLESLLKQMSERKLLTELWAANQFLADKDLTAMFARITETADSICTQLLLHLKKDFPGSTLEILTLGKWAGRELGLRSDLDFIFVTPGSPTEPDFKVARRFISRLTDPSKSGSLYDLDLRLRPSGQSGALLVEKSKLFDYWQSSAQAWERQAYLRARPLSPNSLELKKEFLLQKGLDPSELEELKSIRGKLLRAASNDVIDIKYAPGGLLDIEFVVQTAILKEKILTKETATLDMMKSLAENLPAWAKEEPKLKKIYLQLREFEQMLKLSSANKTSEAKLQSSVFIKAAGLLNLSGEDAWEKLSDLLSKGRQSLNKLDPTGLQI